MLFKQRHSSDYDAFVYCDKEMVDEYYPKAEAFIEEVKNLLESTVENPMKVTPESGVKVAP